MIYNSSVCVKTSTTPYFCTIQNYEFYSADSIYSNDWNYLNKAGAGNFGLGFKSPVWEIMGNPGTKKFDVYMTNFNDWTYVNSTYTPTTT